MVVPSGTKAKTKKLDSLLKMVAKQNNQKGKASLEETVAYLLRGYKLNDTQNAHGEGFMNGQVRVGLVATGAGVSAAGSLGFSMPIGIQGEVGINAKIKGAKQYSLIALNGPPKIEIGGVKKNIPKPIVVTSLLGMYWEAGVGLGIDVSIGAEASAGIGFTNKGVKQNAEAEAGEYSTKDPKPSEPSKDSKPPEPSKDSKPPEPSKDSKPSEPSWDFEVLSIAASAKVGVNAEGNYTYDYFYGEDQYPIDCANENQGITQLKEVLSEGATKGVLKNNACVFIDNNKSWLIEDVQLKGKTLGHTTTLGRKEIISYLQKIIHSDTADNNIKKSANTHIRMLSSNIVQPRGKENAITFINQNKKHWAEGPKKVQLHGEVLGHITTRGHKEIISDLKKIETSTRQAIDDGIKKINHDAKKLIERLQRYTNGGDKSCFLLLSSHSADGKAEAYGKIEAGGQAVIATGSVGAGLSAGISGAYKKAKARFQTVFKFEKSWGTDWKARYKSKLEAESRSETKEARERIYVTYDSVVVYSSFETTAVAQATVEGQFLGWHGSKEAEKKGEKQWLRSGNRDGEKIKERLNQIRYICAVAVWQRPPENLIKIDDQKSFSTASLKKQTHGWKIQDKTPKDLEVKALAGTGFSVGQSFLVRSLFSLYKTTTTTTTTTTAAAELIDQVEGNAYFKTIVSALYNKKSGRKNARVLDLSGLSKPTDPIGKLGGLLKKFFCCEQTYGWIKGMAGNPDTADMGIFIEATYRIDNPDDYKFAVIVGQHKEDANQKQIQLSKDFGKKLRKKGGSLECIRLRVRERELENKDHAIFSVGVSSVKLGPVKGGLKITLEKVDRAGTDAMITLAEVYDVVEGGTNNSPQPPTGTVPPAALFLQ